jgi:DNA-binding XRE family transcriptional regulator
MESCRDEMLRRAYAKVFRRYRKEHELSQEAVALDIGMNRTYIGHLERGAYNPTLETMLRIARVLETPLWKMVREVEDQMKGHRLKNRRKG